MHAMVDSRSASDVVSGGTIQNVRVIQLRAASGK